MSSTTEQFEKSNQEIDNLKKTLQSVDSQKETLQKEFDQFKVEKIQEKTEMSEKFTADKEKLGQIAENLQSQLDKLRNGVDMTFFLMSFSMSILSFFAAAIPSN